MRKRKDLSPYEKAIQKRIIKIIDDYCDGSQQRFVERTGINKGSVSTYVNGKNSISWENAEKVAKAFNIDLNWIMAVDTIPDGIEPAPVPDEIIEFYRQYQNLPPNLKEAVDLMIKSQQPKP